MMNTFATLPSIRITLWIFLLFVSFCSASYMIGVGIADCTGPSAEIVFMGYAKSKQKGCGIHLRQFSRAFVFSDGTTKAAFVSVDAAMMAHGVRREVLLKLSKIFDSTYNESNLILSGTHTHSTPGGFLQDLMLDIPSFGFVRESFTALVDGITESIKKAHENMFEGEMVLAKGELLDANINRSPASYLLNPEEERATYIYNVDKEMVQLKFVRSYDKQLMGAINWFAVHPTSMNNTNCLVSSDNVGYASVLLEKEINRNSQQVVGRGPFVGAFASTNLGDVSPNLKGPRCVNTGKECDNVSSSCEGLAHFCIASGPGKDMFESTRIIAERLYAKASELLKSDNGRGISGPLRFIHRYVDMPKQSALIKLPNGTEEAVKGCLPAMGYSFAAGTTDGPGEFDFTQGTVTSNLFWNLIRDLIFPPTDEDIDCHHPKPILINTGRISFPYEWQAQIVSTQLLQFGDVVLVAVPGEFTTMSGRRLRNTVKEAIINGGGSINTTPIITGLSNVYTSYITTPQEYQLQRYEGASTIYGPHTLTIYQKVYAELAFALMKDRKLDPGPIPPDFSGKLISLTTPVFFDTTGLKRNFGDCILQPPIEAERGSVVQAKFVSGHPRNNFIRTKTFLTVERLLDDGNWTLVATDANWETKFVWQRSLGGLGVSEVTITWEIPDDVVPGPHRIRHFGYYKYLFGGLFPYKGTSNIFQVTNS